MLDTEEMHIDLLVDGEEEGLLAVALNVGDFGLQWHSVPRGGLGVMVSVLSERRGEDRETHVGEILGVPLLLVRREGIFSFKSVDHTGSSNDLLRFDVPSAMVEQLIAALRDAAEEWE